MTAEPPTHSLVSPDGGLQVQVDSLGARIGSIAVGEAATELLARTPWAEEELDSFHRMTSSVHEWHRRYLGGWHTLLPNAGESRVVDGVEHPFHGEAGWRTWRVLHSDDTSCSLQVQLRTIPLEVTRTTWVRDGQMGVEQSVRNVSTTPVRFTWAEHPAFGGALLGERTRLEFGERPIEITVPAPGDAHSAFTTVTDYDAGSYTLTNPDAGLAVTVEFDAALFPHTWVWQEHNATQGFPWWGAVNALGVEPSSRGYELDDGTLGPLLLDAGATLRATFTLSVRGS